jgi:hypothetical protein
MENIHHIVNCQVIQIKNLQEVFFCYVSMIDPTFDILVKASIRQVLGAIPEPAFLSEHLFISCSVS